MSYQNRIKEYRTVDASAIRRNPLNFRRHPDSQKAALRSILSDVGAVSPLLVIPDGDGYMLLDGEARWSEGGAWPVAVLDLSPAEAATVLAMLDKIGADADVDPDALLALLDTLPPSARQTAQAAWSDDELAAIIGDADNEAGDDSATSDEDTPTVEANDTLFPTDNEWGVPLLDIKHQARNIDLPCERWGRKGRTLEMKGTYHFYTDDYKFAALWADPTPLVLSGCRNIIEPNISTGAVLPAAVALWGIYRKRWIARWAQSYGVGVFVDLNVEPVFEQLNLLGVPKGWRSYATRGYDTMADLLEADYQTAVRHAESDDILFVVIGGGTGTHAACMARGWVHIPQENHVIEEREYING